MHIYEESHFSTRKYQKYHHGLSFDDYSCNYRRKDGAQIHEEFTPLYQKVPEMPSWSQPDEGKRLLNACLNSRETATHKSVANTSEDRVPAEISG